MRTPGEVRALIEALESDDGKVRIQATYDLASLASSAGEKCSLRRRTLVLDDIQSQFEPVRYAEFLENIVQVVLDGLLADE